LFSILTETLATPEPASLAVPHIAFVWFQGLVLQPAAQLEMLWKLPSGGNVIVSVGAVVSGVGVAVEVFVGVRVLVVVKVLVTVAVLVGVPVSVAVGVFVAVLVGVRVLVWVKVLVTVGVLVAVFVSVGVLVTVGVFVTVGVLVAVGVPVTLNVAVPPWTPSLAVTVCNPTVADKGTVKEQVPPKLPLEFVEQLANKEPSSHVTLTVPLPLHDCAGALTVTELVPGGPEVGLREIATATSVGVLVGVRVNVGVKVFVGVFVLVAVLVFVGVGVMVGVLVIVGVWVTVGVLVGVVTSSVAVPKLLGSGKAAPLGA
jgi:hypothetical protein